MDKYESVSITLWAAIALKERGFSISGQGSGLDFDEILRNHKSGTHFFDIAGNGFALFHRSENIIA